jgi:hypothetical protein
MENEVTSGNTQATPEAAPPASTGQQIDYAARAAEIQRESEGRLRDLQEERRKRQELEQRLASIPVSPTVPPAEMAVEPQDDVAKVLNPYLAPIKKQAEEALKLQKELMAQKQREDAIQFLSERTGKTRAQLAADSGLLERLDKVAQKWGFVGSFDQVARKAYEAMELEDFRTQQQEKAKGSQVAAQASLPAGAPPASVSSGREMSADEFNRLPPREFDRMAREGSFRKVDGKFVYTLSR